MSSIFSEYASYAAPKERPLDKRFIQNYDTDGLGPLADSVGASSWLPVVLPMKYGFQTPCAISFKSQGDVNGSLV